MSKKLSVLLVDDSRSILAKLERHLAEIDGVEVAGTACSGSEALRSAADLKPDLVLMDIVMPNMDGIAALRVFHTKHPELPVVMVSSLGGSQTRVEEALRLGAVEVIGKPFDTQVLAALFERHLARRESSEAS